MDANKQPTDCLDLSVTLRTIMAARSLSVSEMAAMAGVSKSAMEKYLSGPSSPRATAVASLSKSLGISADTLLFGEIDRNVELANKLAFRAFRDLINDLKTDEHLLEKFLSHDAQSKDFNTFSWNLAYESAAQFRAEYQADRRAAHFVVSML